MSSPPTRRPGGISLSHLSPKTEKSTIATRHSLSDKPIPTLTFIKIQRMVKRWRRRAKNSRHRLMVLKEWITTERNYIRDLELIVAKIEQPMRKSDLLTPEQLQVVFPNVDVLITLSKSMLGDLERIQANWKPSIVKIAPTLLALEPYFRVYIEYCKKYHKGIELLKPLRSQEKFKSLEKTLPMDIDSYLIKPIQRPPKYMLLMRVYHEHMNSSHPDYKQLGVALEKYNLINEINNESIARESRHQTFFKLEKLYGHLLESNRELKRQMRASTIECELRLYVFNDLILLNRVIDEHREDSYKALELDKYSFVEVIPDGKYFCNKLLLCGKYEAVHLFFASAETIKREHQFFKELFQQLLKTDLRKQLKEVDHRQRSEQKVAVTINSNNLQQMPFLPHFKITVRGVEKRPLALLRNETVYKVRYQTMKPWCLHQNVQLHYSKLETLYTNLNKRFPDLLFPDLSPAVLEVGLYDQTKNRSKIIEYRIMAIQQFLNRVFRCDRIMVNPVSILEVLGICNALWMFAVDYSQQQTTPKCECKACRQLGTRKIGLEQYLSERARFILEKTKLQASDYCMVRYTRFEEALLQTPRQEITKLEYILLFLDAYQGQLDFMRVFRPNRQQSLEIRVYLLNVSHQDYIELQLNEETTAGEVLSTIGGQLGILNLQDFALFLNYDGEPRALEPHEPIYEAMVQVEAEVTELSGKSLLSTLKQGFKYIGDLVKGKKSKLYLRKFMFFMPEVEYFACRTNQARYRLLVEQGFYDISRDLIHPDDESLAKITALFICLKDATKVSSVGPHPFPRDLVRKLLPEHRYKLLENDPWVQEVCREIEKTRSSKHSTPQHLYECLLRILQHNLGWQHHYFPLQSHDPSRLRGGHADILLGISYRSLVVVSRKGLELLLQIPLELLSYKISVFSFNAEHEQQSYRFDGRMLYDVDRLIRKYLLMRRLFPHLYDTVSQSEIKTGLSVRTTQDT